MRLSGCSSACPLTLYDSRLPSWTPVSPAPTWPKRPRGPGPNPPQPSSPIPCVFHAEGQCGDRARATLGPHLLPLCRLGVSSGDAEWQGAGVTVARTELALCLCCAPRTGPVRSGHKSVRRGSGPRPPRALPDASLAPERALGAFRSPQGPAGPHAGEVGWQAAPHAGGRWGRTPDTLHGHKRGGRELRGLLA